jgi:hypothetical protein
MAARGLRSRARPCGGVSRGAVRLRRPAKNRRLGGGTCCLRCRRRHVPLATCQCGLVRDAEVADVVGDDGARSAAAVSRMIWPRRCSSSERALDCDHIAAPGPQLGCNTPGDSRRQAAASAAAAGAAVTFSRGERRCIAASEGGTAIVRPRGRQYGGKRDVVSVTTYTSRSVGGIESGRVSGGFAAGLVVARVAGVAAASAATSRPRGAGPRCCWCGCLRAALIGRAQLGRLGLVWSIGLLSLAE